MCAVDGETLLVIPLPSALGSDLPGLLGMMRPALHRILIDRATAKGLAVRTGLSPKLIDDHGDGTTVTFSDGSVTDYDLVIGADGVRSSMREFIAGTITPTFQQQVCYRTVVTRPESVTREVAFVGSDGVDIGFTPTGKDSMYVYCLVPAQDTTRPSDADLPEIVRAHLAIFGGVVSAIREQITDPAQVNFTTLETVIAPEPWYRGRTVLVGDSAHSTTPHLAAGAAMCLEDALVLGEELTRQATIRDALRVYSKRRFDRCKYVVETSAQIGYWQTHPGTPGADQEGLRAAATAVLSGPF